MIKINNGSESPRLALKLRCGSNASKLAATNEYFSGKNLRDKVYIGNIVATEIMILRIRAMFV